MSSDLIQMMDYVAQQRGLERDELFGMITRSLRESAKRAVLNYEDVDAEIDPKSGAISCWANLDVVEEVTNRASEISLGEALTRFPGITVGERVKWALKTEQFGRIAAQYAKQLLTGGLQAAEKRHVVSTFQNDEGQLITGTVVRRDKSGIWIDFGSTEGLMPHKACSPLDNCEPGYAITALLKSLNPDKPGASLFVTRVSKEFIQRIFEREVSEIKDGTVVIKGIAREPGYRTKIAVYSEQEKVDPVGACVGRHGDRVKRIVDELGGEKVDIINWSPDIREFVTNALKPAKLATVTIIESEKTLDVRVNEDQLSLSIGKKGQNARLAAKLTGWKINISKLEKNSDSAATNSMQEQIQAAINTITQATGVSESVAEVLVGNGYHSIEGLHEATFDDLEGLDGIDAATALQIVDAVRAYRQ